MKKNYLKIILENRIFHSYKNAEGKKQIPMQTTSHFKKKHYKWSPILCFFPQMHSLSSYEERAIVLSLGLTWSLLTAHPGWIGINCWDFCFTFHLGPLI